MDLLEPLWGETGFKSHPVQKNPQVFELEGRPLHFVLIKGHPEVVAERDDGLVRGGVSGGETVLTQGTGACTSEGSGVELGVYLSPGCKLEPSCLFPKGDIIGQASAKMYSILQVAIMYMYAMRSGPLIGWWEARWWV